MKVYTKTGDKGTTSLIGGTRVVKNDSRLNAYGTVDELNSFVGLLISFLPENENALFFESIQNVLFDLGAALALDREKCKADDFNLVVEQSEIERLEREIDRLDAFVPPLNCFVMPGGTQQASLAHVCRTVTRRAERLTHDVKKDHSVEDEILIYLNRLSDYFFLLSRYLNNIEGKEKKYIKK